MNKSILVIDTPKNCKECPCGQSYELTNFEYYCCCGALDKQILEGKYSLCVPDWCPLKPIPDREDHKSILSKGFVSGWNSCIDEILGGAK